MMMKMWLDDVRPAPDGTWVLTKNVDEAITFLEKCRLEGKTITLASLDHDLGGMAYNFCAACRATVTSQEAFHEIFIHGCKHMKVGRVVVEWMRENVFWPATIVIHSWNSEGAKRMADIAAQHTSTFLKPFGQDIAIRVDKKGEQQQ